MENSKKRKEREYVTGLLTGRNQTRKNKDGQMIEAFVPNVINKHAPLSSALNHPKMTTDEIMVQEQLRCSVVNIDYKMFQKTDSEKKRLKKMKAEYKSKK